MIELPAAEDQDPVEALVPQTAHPALGVSVGVRRPDRCADDPDALGLEDGVEADELAVAIATESGTVAAGRRGPISSLRACCATRRPSGLSVQATYSIPRRSSEM
jgi:hypothetical protein